MPRLKERSDGCYYIVHHYRDCNTWQLDGDGVNFLNKLNIHAGDTFTTDVFMLMWEHRLIYVGESRKAYWQEYDTRAF